MGGRRMKKLLMTASNWSHISNFHLPYLQAFQQIGWETHVACAGISEHAPFIDRAIDLPFEKKISAPVNFQVARTIRRLVRTERYDLIITHTSLGAFFTRFALKGMAGRPRLVNVVHGYLFDDDTQAAKKNLLLNAERLTVKETDLLLTMNEWDYLEAKRYRLAKRIEKIPGMGVDFARFEACLSEDSEEIRDEYGIPRDAFVLIYAAEFSKRKSQHVLIEAMQRLPNHVRLVLCGEGDQLSACKELAARLGLSDRVLFPGQVRNVGSWYKTADAVAASSRIEGLPFNILEAMYLGLPVVASRVKGHADLIRDGENGLLYPYADAEKCASAVKKLILSKDLRQKLGAQAARDSKQYEINAVLPIVMRFYTDQK